MRICALYTSHNKFVLNIKKNNYTELPYIVRTERNQTDVEQNLKDEDLGFFQESKG